MVQTIEKYSKGLISLLILAFAAAALFWGGDVFGFKITADFEAKVIALIPLLAALVGVVMSKNATPDAIDKAAMQLVNGLIGVALFFHEIPSDTGVKIGAFISAFVAAYFVWLKSNGPTVTVAPTHTVKSLPG